MKINVEHSGQQKGMHAQLQPGLLPHIGITVTSELNRRDITTVGDVANMTPEGICDLGVKGMTREKALEAIEAAKSLADHTSDVSTTTVSYLDHEQSFNFTHDQRVFMEGLTDYVNKIEREYAETERALIELTDHIQANAAGLEDDDMEWPSAELERVWRDLRADTRHILLSYRRHISAKGKDPKRWLAGLVQTAMAEKDPIAWLSDKGRDLGKIVHMQPKVS